MVQQPVRPALPDLTLLPYIHRLVEREDIDAWRLCLDRWPVADPLDWYLATQSLQEHDRCDDQI